MSLKIQKYMCLCVCSCVFIQHLLHKYLYTQLFIQQYLLSSNYVAGPRNMIVNKIFKFPLSWSLHPSQRRMTKKKKKVNYELI